ELAALAVGGFVFLGLLHHALHFLFGEVGGRRDLDLLLAAGRLVLGGHVENTVGVDVKGDLDLWHAARSRRDAIQPEAAERLVVGGHRPLALQDVNVYGGLAVFGRAEDFRLARRNRRVARDQRGYDRAHRLQPEAQRGHVEQQNVLDVTRENVRLDFGLARRNRRVARDQRGHDRGHRLQPEAQRGHVEQQNVLDVTRENARLDCGAHRHNLVRVDALVRGLAGHVLDELLDHRHTGGAADEDHLVNLLDVNAGVAEGFLDRLAHALDQILGQLLELRAGQLHLQMLGAAGVSRNERQVDFALLQLRKLNLGFLGRLAQPLQGLAIRAQVNALILLDLLDHPIHNPLVPVVATQMSVAAGRHHLDNAIADVQNRDVEGTAAEVKDENGLIGFLVEPVGQGGRRRLVDDALHVKTGNAAGVLRG